MNISRHIILWYRKNKRDLPWRNTKDPYQIWVSEIILQQTRVAQGIFYYREFIKKFPDIDSLARATEQQVLKIWQGLGYYTRARNMLQAAQYIYYNLNGTFPDTYKKIAELKGIGEYTASAIASFSFGLPFSLCDGNVYRVLSRFYGIKSTTASAEGKKLFSEKAQSILDRKRPGLHNQAIMEFGALQCIPAKPDCFRCPLKMECYAFTNGKVDMLPVRNKKPALKNRFFHYLLIRQGDYLYLHQREGKDIWTGLYEFPLIETTEKCIPSKIFKSKQWEKILNDTRYETGQVSSMIIHILSHQKIYARFYHINILSSCRLKKDDFIRIHFRTFEKYPVPVLIHNYMTRKIKSMKN